MICYKSLISNLISLPTLLRHSTASGLRSGLLSPLAPPLPRQNLNGLGVGQVCRSLSSKQQFCRECSGQLRIIVPDGDSRSRNVCRDCGYTDYLNPKLVVGAIIEHDDKILLCRRGIEPQRGLWSVPAGFLELGESTATGAVRETKEEAGADIIIDAPYAHFDIVGIGQAYLLFRGRLKPPYTFEAQQPETLEAQLFPIDQIPFQEIAFSSVAIALQSYIEDRQTRRFRYHHATIVKRPGAGPNEPGTFTLVDNISIPTEWGLEHVQSQGLGPSD